MKAFIWGGLGIGSTIGGFLPALWGGSVLSFSSVILTAVGGIVGIWAGVQVARYMGY